MTWGEQTTDEMCIGFVGYTVDSEHLTKGVPADDAPEVAQAVRDTVSGEMLTQFDKDGDGTLDAAELTTLLLLVQEKSGGKPLPLLQTANPKQAAHGLSRCLTKITTVPWIKRNS